MPRLTAARALAVACLGLSAAGCMSTTRPEITGSVPTDYRQRHPIAVKESERTVEVFVGMRRGGLTASQRNEIRAFAESWRREATGGIVIDVPAGTPNARAAAEAASEARGILAGAGVPSRAIDARGYRPGDPAMLATLKLNYPRMAAQAGPCGIWPDDLGPTVDPKYNANEPYHNLGCATQRNLAAMVDDPADLVQPRAETPSYSARRSTVLDKYRKGESTATTYPEPKGTLSDVGR